MSPAVAERPTPLQSAIMQESNARKRCLPRLCEKVDVDSSRGSVWQSFLVLFMVVAAVAGTLPVTTAFLSSPRQSFHRIRFLKPVQAVTESPLDSTAVNASKAPRAAADGAKKPSTQKATAQAIDIETYETNLKIAQLAEQCAKHKNVTAAIHATSLLRSMSHPDTVAYNSVIKCLAKLSPANINGSQTASNLCLVMLEEMKDIHEKQRKANLDWYDRMGANQLSEKELSAGSPRVRVKPNVRTYATVMDALARTAKIESAELAEDLMQELHDEYYETNDWAMQPNLVTYNTLLTAWAKVAGGEAAHHCLRILEVMPMTPDTISFNTVLHAVARSGWLDCGERAEGLLRSMKDEGVAANARSYTTCIDAWGQNQPGNPQRAELLLQEIEALYEETGDPQLQPNCVSYSTVINAYATSKELDKAMQAHAVFQRMRQKGIEPNPFTYNNLLNSFATSKAHPELIDMVEKVYRQMLREHLSDQVTFGIVLKACSNLFWKDVEFAPSVFREACDRGQVSSGVLWQLRQAVPAESFRELVGADQVAWGELPHKWTRNVRDDRTTRRNKRR